VADAIYIYIPNINAEDDVRFRGDKVVQIGKMFMENGSMSSDYSFVYNNLLRY